MLPTYTFLDIPDNPREPGPASGSAGSVRAQAGRRSISWAVSYPPDYRRNRKAMARGARCPLREASAAAVAVWRRTRERWLRTRFP